MISTGPGGSESLEVVFTPRTGVLGSWGVWRDRVDLVRVSGIDEGKAPISPVTEEAVQETSHSVSSAFIPTTH